LERLSGLGKHGTASPGGFIEHQPGGFFATLVELSIEGDSTLAFPIKSLRRLRLLVGGSLQLPLKLGDAFFGNHHLLVKLVALFIDLTRDRILIDQAECDVMW
jgi:hypothetical protein